MKSQLYFCLLLIYYFSPFAITAQPATILNFDGADDHVVLPQVVNGSFTMEYWMKTTTTAPFGSGITAHWWSGSGIVDAEVASWQHDFGTALYDDKIAFGIGELSGGDVTIFSTTSVNSGNWVHVAVTWDQPSGQMQLYINGILESTGIGSTAFRTAPPAINIGRLQTGVNPYFSGSIDELRIWNTVRSSTQISGNMYCEITNPASQNSLLAYYRFNQGVAGGLNTQVTTLTDLSTSNANGTLNNFTLNGNSSNWLVGSVVGSVPTVVISTTKNMICAGQSATLTASGATNFTWSTGSASYSTVVTPLMATTYTLIASNNSSCTGTFSFLQTVSICNGLLDLANTEGIQIYPNPTRGEITIGTLGETELVIYNVLGEVVLRDLVNGYRNFSFTDQPASLYLLSFKNKSGEFELRKILKE